MKKIRHCLSMADLSQKEILFLIKFARQIKANPNKYKNILKNKTLLMIFEKSSLRTRVSFEVGMTQMGGHAIYYDVKNSPLGKKETVEDTARTASRYVDIVMIRANKQADIRAFAANATVPVIDALSDYAHPCQMLADWQTMNEKGKDIQRLKLAYLGNGRNNVTYDLMRSCAILGASCFVACPQEKEYNVEKVVIEECQRLAKKTKAKIVVTGDPEIAAKGADVVYTDTWVNYDIPIEQLETRSKKLMPYQVTQKIMGLAKARAIFMNCLPAMRGKEQTAEVIDGSQSVVFDQAENRLHAQKALMIYLLRR